MIEKIFPTVIIVLEFGAAAVYVWNRDFKMAGFYACCATSLVFLTYV